MARDPLDKNTGDLLRPRSPGAIRQARFKSRMEADGYRRRPIWVHEISDYQGYARAVDGAEPTPIPEGVEDLASYLIGWARGHAERAGTARGER